MRGFASVALLLLCAIFSLPLSSAAEAEAAAALVVEGAGVTVDATTGATARVTLPVVNHNKGTIGILSIESSCGCIQALVDRSTFAPGERGVLEIVLDTEGRFGLAQREVLLHTTAGGDPVKVSFAVRYPPGPTLLPKFTYWPRGAPAEPKRIIIGLPAEYRAAYTGLTVDDGAWFRIDEISRSEAGGERQIILAVAPVDTAVVRKSVVVFSFADGKELRAHVRIVEPKP